MSLFTREEICEGCIFAVWIDANAFWDGQPRFARCKEGHETQVNACHGTCDFKTRDKDTEQTILQVDRKPQ